jgi:hypothetical protein
LPAVIDDNGDMVITLFDGAGRRLTRRVAELVLETFVGPCPPGHELRFKDGNRLNCELANLEWANVVLPDAALTVGPPTVRAVRVDDEGHLFTESGEPIHIPGLGPDEVLQGLAEAEAGHGRSLRAILDERRR